MKTNTSIFTALPVLLGFRGARFEACASLVKNKLRGIRLSNPSYCCR